MSIRTALVAAAVALSASAAFADDSVIVLGRAAYGAHCAICHGSDAKGGGELAQMLTVKPANLTTLKERDPGKAFPFSEVYQVISLGKSAPGHGTSQMPIWGSYFRADALKDRGVNGDDADFIAVGRALSLAYYLESIQQ